MQCTLERRILLVCCDHHHDRNCCTQSLITTRFMYIQYKDGDNDNRSIPRIISRDSPMNCGSHFDLSIDRELHSTLSLDNWWDGTISVSRPAGVFIQHLSSCTSSSSSSGVLLSRVYHNVNILIFPL